MPFTDRLGASIRSSAEPADKWRGSPENGNDGLGLNVSVMAFLDSWSESTFEVTITRELLAEFKSAGVDFVRLPFNPSYLMGIDAATFAARWQAIDNAIALCLAADLRVYANVHLWSLPTSDAYTAAQCLADYPAGTWSTYETVVSRIATQLLKYDPADVALGQLNEAPGTYANWSTIAARLYTVIRAANPDITVFVSGDNYSGADNLIGLDPTLFTGNVRFAFTPYEPQIFTHRRVLSTVPYDIPHEENFPPIESQEASIVTAMQSNVDADTSVGSGDKAAWKTTLEGYLDDYYTGRNGLEPTWLNRKTAAIAGWCGANDIDPLDVIISEIGVSTEGVQVDSLMNSNMRWFAGQRRQALRHGFGGITAWDYSINGPFSINTVSGDLADNYVVALGGRPLKAYTGRMQRAFSLMSAGNMPSRRVQDVMNAASDRLETLGLWDLLSVLYFWTGCADSSDIALFNWKAPDSYKLTSSGSPIFERNKGWRSGRGKASVATQGDDLLSTGFIPGISDAIFTQNANHMGFWQRDGFAEEDFTQYVVGDTTGQNFLACSQASMVIGLAVQDFTHGEASVSDNGFGTDALGTARKGHFVCVREDSSTVTAYKDGGLVAGSISSTSHALTGVEPIKLLRTVRSGLNGFHCGGILTAQNVIDLYTVFDFVAVALDDPS